MHLPRCKYARMLAGMAGLDLVADLEERASKAGLTLLELCARANVAHTTTARWKAGKTEPTFRIYRKLLEAIDSPAPNKATRSNPRRKRRR